MIIIVTHVESNRALPGYRQQVHVIDRCAVHHTYIGLQTACELLGCLRIRILREVEFNSLTFCVNFQFIEAWRFRVRVLRCGVKQAKEEVQ